MGCPFQIGDIIEVADNIDPENQPTTIATVKYIESDDIFPDIYFLYLIANEEVLNTKIDNKIGYYWDITTHNSPFIRLLSRATIS